MVILGTNLTDEGKEKKTGQFPKLFLSTSFRLCDLYFYGDLV